MDKRNYNEGFSEKGFIVNQCRKIDELMINKKFSIAKKRIYQLLNDYPNDFGLLKLLARILILENDYQAAKEILENMDMEYSSIKLPSIYIKLNEEEKLRDLYEKYYKDDDTMLDSTIAYHEAKRSVKLYLEKRFNITSNIDKAKLTYFERQICDYSDEEAINHIMENHYNNSSIYKSIFYNEINIEELFYKVKDNIYNNSGKETIHKNISENYYFYYPKCGVQIDEQGNKVYPNTIKVCTLLGTNEIITMYPFCTFDNTEICYFKEKENTSKIKVKSGIERFNSRYSNIK